MIRFLHHQSVDSTNNVARLLVADGTRERLVITADRQTAGRGRQGRAWFSPKGGCWMSLIQPLGRGTLGDRARSLLPLATGLAAAEACEPVASIEGIRLKWPNDLIVEGPGGWHKLGGVLCETCSNADRDEAMIIGVGINVNNPMEHLEAQPGALPPTSLGELAGAEIKLSAVVRAIAERIYQHLDGLAEDACLNRTHASITKRLPIGQTATIASDPSATGTIAGITEVGHLILATPEGERTISSGEVRLNPACPPDAPNSSV